MAARGIDSQPIDLDLSTITGRDDVALLESIVTAFQPSFSSVFLSINFLEVSILAAIASILSKCNIETIYLTNAGRSSSDATDASSSSRSKNNYNKRDMLSEDEQQTIADALTKLAAIPSVCLDCRGGILDARRLQAILKGLERSPFRWQLLVEFGSNTLHGDAALDQITRAFCKEDCSVKSLHILPHLHNEEWWSLTRLIESSQLQELKLWAFFDGVDNTVAYAMALHSALAQNTHLETLALHVELPVYILDALFRGLASNTSVRVVEMERLRAETLPYFVHHLASITFVKELDITLLSGSAAATQRGYKSLLLALQKNISVVSLKGSCMPDWLSSQAAVFLRRNFNLQRAREIAFSPNEARLGASGLLLSHFAQPKDRRLWSSAVYTLVRQCLPKLKEEKHEISHMEDDEMML